jgi:hypothetical protein
VSLILNAMKNLYPQNKCNSNVSLPCTLPNLASGSVKGINPSIFVYCLFPILVHCDSTWWLHRTSYQNVEVNHIHANRHVTWGHCVIHVLHVHMLHLYGPYSSVLNPSWQGSLDKIFDKWKEFISLWFLLMSNTFCLVTIAQYNKF